ncbi:hypothetical protein DVR12_11370 [Chitinophaga silvatica]|uniref:Globin-sensor domain-containing protein n=1 Tax=Chitinophaga silvatica TaxID=2282649 RepID=A0A3E1Y9N7_9BACT|nr:protoglobin domain-containing protein [Chitinophaga silvatica]RFS22405.1 hypothetical protein DVR12_11370 [Chitinophaga silvatica]
MTDISNQGPDQPPSTPDVQTLVRIKRMLLYTYEDEQYLVKAGEILQPYVEDILNEWYDYLLTNNYLSIYFSRNGQPDQAYLEALRPQFLQWITVLLKGRTNSEWWQLEERIAALMEKNNDQDSGSLPLIYLRYLTTFVYPIVGYGKHYLDQSGKDKREISLMQQAWFKAICFSALLWVYPSGQRFE